jgi:hypothetical protein
MTNPKRYGTSSMPCDTGIYVLFSEYEKVVAECERLRETIKRQASAARAGMHAATRASSIRLELAEQSRAESSPEVLVSERAMNAMLTEENEALRADAERMEYLEAHKWKDDRDGGYSGSYSFRVPAYSASTWSGAIPFSHATLREAIDAARKEKA